MIVEVLFPEICNLYGDLYNTQYLKQSDPSIELIETSLKTKPSFLDRKVDLIYMGTTTELGLKLCVEALKPYTDKLKELINEGQFILLTGNALDVFSNYIDSDEDDRIEGLGIINTHTEYKMLKRHNSFYVGDFDLDGDKSIRVMGFKSIFGHTYPEDNDSAYDDESLFRTVRGFGRNPDAIPEGFKIKNLFATYLTGPLLIINPLFTEWFLKQLGSTCKPAFYKESMDSYNKRLLDMMDEERIPEYGVHK